MRILIIGCGYVGSALARELLTQGHEVIGVTKTEASAKLLLQSGISSMVADCSTSVGAQRACEKKADVVVFSVSSRGGDYEATYVEGMRQVLNAIKERPPRLFFYTGSTSVYAQTNGDWVTETSETLPPHANGKALLNTENLLKSAATECFESYILRISGIYGPKRHAVLDKLTSGASVISGSASRWINQVHRDDVVGAIVLLITKANGQCGSTVLNVTDDRPVLQEDYIRWLCQKLGRSIPGYDSENSERRNTANRRISNRSLHSLGWTPRFPGFQEGMSGFLKTPTAGIS